MARGFGSTFGAGSTDKIACSYAASLGTKVSFSFWLYQHGAGGGSNGRILELGTANTGTTLATISGGFQFIYNFTGTKGVWSYSSLTQNAWQHIVLSYDSSSTSNMPSVYVNGALQSMVTGQSPSGTSAPLSGAYLIGNRNDNSRNMDGMLAEFAVWSGTALTAGEAAALARGLPPLFVRPTSLSLYLPLYGTSSGEPDWGPSHGTQAITGAKKQNHAPASFWMPPSPIAPATQQNFSGSLALTQGASSTALSLCEKFAGRLALTAPVNSAVLSGLEMPARPGHAALTDAAQGGLLTINERTTSKLILSDTGLYRVTLSESL
jgi:hypothetical protein